MDQRGGEPLLSALCNISSKIMFCLYSVFFSFLPSKSQPPHHSVLHMPAVHHPIFQHKTIFTFLGFIVLKAQVSVIVYPPLCFFIPPLYICFSLHPAIGILLTLACLIRVRQRERKTKASPFLPPSTCPLPHSSVSSLSHLPLTQSAGSHGDSANWFVKSHSLFHGILRTFLWQDRVLFCQMIWGTNGAGSLPSLFLPAVCVHCCRDCELIVSWIIYLFGVATSCYISLYSAVVYISVYLFKVVLHIRTLHICVVNTESIRINYAAPILTCQQIICVRFKV